MVKRNNKWQRKWASVYLTHKASKSCTSSIYAVFMYMHFKCTLSDSSPLRSCDIDANKPIPQSELSLRCSVYAVPLSRSVFIFKIKQMRDSSSRTELVFLNILWYDTFWKFYDMKWMCGYMYNMQFLMCISFFYAFSVYALVDNFSKFDCTFKREGGMVARVK